ncbi:MAG: flagellar biosynthesis protein FlhB [Lachnospiraceae bacterium]|nr:flagellar biosynthesis protein FlhB [Lachnospiraceae bacterium]
MIYRAGKRWDFMYSFKYDLQLFAKDGEGGEKTEEPTAKKLSDARKKGQAAKSKEITTASSLLIFFIAIKIFLGFLGERFLTSYYYLYSGITKYTDNEFTLQIACSLMGSVFQIIIITLIPFLAVSFVTVFISELVQVKWQVSFEPMKPNFNKFNPISGMKRLFSKDKIVDLVISLVKIAVLTYIVYDFLKDRWAMVLNMYSYTLFQAIELIGNTVIDIGIRISVIFFIIAVADWRYRKWKFHEDMKMTKQEVKDEFKNAEGDPKIKSQQRARMQQASQRRMMNALPQADVVITNPTHLAVAILYDKTKYEAPIVVAKGADFLAAKIKDVANENDIEIVENKPLARMLYHNVDVGAQIPPELYQMVAEILAYVYNIKGKL